MSPPLTEVLYACYFGFYLFFLVPPFLLFRARRDVDLERYVFALMSALYVCYLGFLVVPLAGPGVSLAGQLHPADPDRLRDRAAAEVHHGQGRSGRRLLPVGARRRARGRRCSRSGRCSGRAAFRWVLPFTVGLTVAVVYTRYHYLSDALAGLAVAAVVFPLVSAAGLADRRRPPTVHNRPKPAARRRPIPGPARGWRRIDRPRRGQT